MRPLNRAFIVIVAAAACAVVVALLYFSGNVAAGNVLLGVLAGSIVTGVAQWMQHARERATRQRAAALLWRSDMYQYQEWILSSIDHGEWRPAPKPLATSEHLAEIAHWADNWNRWEPIAGAHRRITRVVDECVPEATVTSSALVGRAFRSINDARIEIAKLDGGPERPHPRSGTVENWV